MSVVDPQEILKYINEARTTPQKFAQYIKKDIDQFSPDGRNIPLKPGLNYQTNEGIAAWKQCYKVLKQAKPLPPYKLNKFMSLASQDHADDMGKNNFQGHKGSDGSTMASRLWKRCSKSNQGYQMGQNIGGDFKIAGRNHALNTVKALLIDDGVSDRGHRKNLLSSVFTNIGLGSAVVGDKIRVVMDFLNYEPVSSTGTGDAQVQAPLKKQINYNEKKSNDFGFGIMQGKDIGQGFGFGQWKDMNQKYKVKNQGNNDKYAVSTQTKTQTSTSNGKTVTKTIIKTKYSDGSTETNQTVSTKTKS